jgi:hypothetical protein
VSTGVLPRLMTCLGPRTEVAGLVARMPPVTSQSNSMRMDGGEVLLDGRLRYSLLERLYIGGDVERLDIDQRDDPAGVEPGEEIRDRPVIGHAGVLVADGSGKEFEEAAHRVAGAGDRRRHGEAGTPWACCRGCPGPPNRDDLYITYGA